MFDVVCMLEETRATTKNKPLLSVQSGDHMTISDAHSGTRSQCRGVSALCHSDI